MPVQLSIIIPVFNEAANIQPLAREVAAALDKFAGGYELVFVDDASVDQTWEEIQAAHQADSRVHGLRLERNSGQSAALWTGIQATTTPLLATLDGDRQNDPADLPPMLAELERYDFVCGMRLQREDNWIRRVSSGIARRARRLILKSDFHDTGCALRVFKRSALEGLFGFNGLHRFLPILVQSGGARTLEIPVRHRPRVAGVSKYGIGNRLWRGIYDLMAVAWYQKRRVRPVAYRSWPEKS